MSSNTLSLSLSNPCCCHPRPRSISSLRYGLSVHLDPPSWNHFEDLRFSFKFTLKFLGVSDVWNSNIIAAQMLLQANPAGTNNNNQPPSQQQANSAVAQNKARIETILYYLNLLRYNNLPKANVLQTMTTPKNWLWMLQILQFLANDCKVRTLFHSSSSQSRDPNEHEWVFFKFYMINDASKLMYAFRGDNEILHEFLRKTYVQTLYDQTYLKSERHAKVKEESLEKFGKTSEDHGCLGDFWPYQKLIGHWDVLAQQLRAGYNLDHLKAETESIKKDYDFLKSTEVSQMARVGIKWSLFPHLTLSRQIE